MVVYGIQASGPMVCFDHQGILMSRKLYRQYPTAEQVEAFRSKLISSGASSLKDLVPEEAQLIVVQFELED